MFLITKTYVDTPAGQVEGCEPAIVFLHQTALSAKTYDPTLRVLDVPNQLIAINTPPDLEAPTTQKACPHCSGMPKPFHHEEDQSQRPAMSAQ